VPNLVVVHLTAYTDYRKPKREDIFGIHSNQLISITDGQIYLFARVV